MPARSPRAPRTSPRSARAPPTRSPISIASGAATRPPPPPPRSMPSAGAAVRRSPPGPRPRPSPAAAQAAAPPPTPPTLEQRAQVYLRIGLDEASRQLGGPVHVIEGMSAMFMGMAQGVAVPGADATRPVVRVVYQDSQGRLILLDQQRLRPGQASAAGFAPRLGARRNRRVAAWRGRPRRASHLPPAGSLARPGRRLRLGRRPALPAPGERTPRTQTAFAGRRLRAH